MRKIERAKYLAEIATKLKLIDESDWKTPKIVFHKHRDAVVKKGLKNGIKMARKYFGK